MKVFILTYHENIKEAERLKKELLDFNFPNPIIINNLPRCDKIHIKPPKIIYLNFLYYILPFVDDDFLFFEDDAVINKDYKVIKNHFDKGLVSRIGYLRDNKAFIQGSHCVGFKKEVIPQLKDYMFERHSRAIHFDRFLCNFNRDILKEGQYYVPPLEQRLIGFKSHYSIINNGFRDSLDI